MQDADYYLFLVRSEDKVRILLGNINGEVISEIEDIVLEQTEIINLRLMLLEVKL